MKKDTKQEYPVEELVRIIDESTNLEKKYELVTDITIKNNINSLMQQAFSTIDNESSDEIKISNAKNRIKAAEHLAKAALELEKIK